MTYNTPDPDDFDAWFPKQATPTANQAGQRLGVVVGGSLSKGLSVRLDRDIMVEDIAVGRYVVVHSANGVRFFCMVTDVQLNSTNPGIEADPPNFDDAFIREVYGGTASYATVAVAPQLSIPPDENKPKPVKTIPGHFTPVFNASVSDVNAVFGEEDATHFNVGVPLELEDTQINLDLKRLVERSIGVFGKSGTGKSFLTRVLISGVIQRGLGVNLIFDMHNDYGWEASDERGPKAKGLKQLFSTKVEILTLDAESSRRRQASYDREVKLAYSEILPEDLAMLRETMGFSDAMIDAAYTLHKWYIKRGEENWVKKIIHLSAEDAEEIAGETPIGAGTISALQRRLSRFERWHFLTEEKIVGTDSVDRILHLIIQERKSVVLEFGRYGSSLEAYMLVANYITRRIHHEYIQRVERALGDPSMEPPQLLITIEEAHKFLDPKIASQTIFGEIARELRKYKVTLLVVDQRPSGIDEEVMSQIGTRVTALLDNERDINAVLTGINGAQSLRQVLARLDTKQQAIIMGHAVPMPVVVKTRGYDQAFYDAMMGVSATPKPPTLPNGEGGRKERRIR
ncbi:MAG: helicase HerA domain-containing protein [Phototrophicaceae bacterium]|jgi:DNA helicase HerA-like ATPase